MKAQRVVYGKWILYCLFRCQLVQILDGNPKNLRYWFVLILARNQEEEIRLIHVTCYYRHEFV